MSLVRVPCRTCGKEVVADEDLPLPEHFPFCSRRCRLIDIGKWADEEYRIADARTRPPEDDGATDAG